VHRVFGLVRRLLWVVVFLVVILVTASAGLLAVLTVRGLPTTNGTLAIAGLDGDARVVRDANGIATIEADTAHDLFLAQGYVHAQDRMWQMEVWRHISAGRLSELFGSSTIAMCRRLTRAGAPTPR
jgi:penicillin amidase